MRVLVVAFLLLTASSTSSTFFSRAKAARLINDLGDDNFKSLSDDPLESTDYPTDEKTGRGPWNKIVALGDIHGDMDQALILLKETGVVTQQPDYYSKMVLQQARMAGSSAYGDSYVNEQTPAEGEKKGRRKATKPSQKRLTADQKKIDDGLGSFLPKDIAANMIYNKRGAVMGGTADEFHWGIGKALVVILGDCMNVGPDDIAAITLIRRLTREADLAGGKVVFVLGNHEVMNLRGDFSGVHPWSFERTSGAAGRKYLLSTETPIGRFVRSRPGIFYYDNLMFMHGGLMPGAIKTVERAVGDGSQELPAKHLAAVINKHVRNALFDHQDDPKQMDKDPIAATVLNVNYDENGKNGILLVHPLDQCEKVQRANNMTGLESQIVGHTPHDLPEYSFCKDALYAIDLKASKWKGGSGAVPAALVLLREELAAYELRNPPVTNSQGVGVYPPPNRTTAAPKYFQKEGHSITAARNADYRWTSRLVIPKEVYEQTHSQIGGWTSISAIGFVLWVGILVIVFELIRLVYKWAKKHGKIPNVLRNRVDGATSFCDVIASYMPCSGSIYSRGVPLDSGKGSGGARRNRRGEYEEVDGHDGQHLGAPTNLRPTVSSPF